MPKSGLEHPHSHPLGILLILSGLGCVTPFEDLSRSHALLFYTLNLFYRVYLLIFLFLPLDCDLPEVMDYALFIFVPLVSPNMVTGTQ